MIVKNEEHVLPRCLSALKPYIDAWCIMDTGSEDSTIQVINEQLDGIPGKLVEEPFESFRYNRTKVMQIAREEFNDVDYLLMIDADDTWTIEEGFEWPENMIHGCYNVKHTLHSTAFFRPAVTHAKLPWRYEGAAHEYQVCDQSYSRGQLDKVSIVCGNDGHRRKTEGRAKYDRIAKILEEEYKKDPTDTRTVFYLAQSYRDGGHIEKAIKFYRMRSGMGGFAEEVWYSLYQVAFLTEKLNIGLEITREAYLQAYENRPSRAETLWRLAALHRVNGLNHLGRIYALAAVNTKRPDDVLFVDEWVYTWRCYDELCVNSQKIGLLEDARAAALKILNRPEVIHRNRIRAEENLTWSSRIITPKAIGPDEEITVVLSTYKGDPSQIREAVESIIQQTYSNWRLLVISDGDEKPPWKALDGIDDPRIVKIHLPDNVGQFPIYDAVIRETKSPLFAIQDDDDISNPARFALLVDKMRRTNADVVFSDLESEGQDGEYTVQPSHPEWLAATPTEIVHVGSHVGLWKSESIRRIGGYYGGFDIGADTMVVGLVAQLGRAAYLHERLYRARRGNADSMTRRNETKLSTRGQVWDEIRSLWYEARENKNPVTIARRLMLERAKKKNKEIHAIRKIIREKIAVKAQ